MGICSYLATTLVPHRAPFLLLAALLIPTIVYAADVSGPVVSILDGDTSKFCTTNAVNASD